MRSSHYREFISQATPKVIKKWLSYRELAVHDRLLTPDEAREVQHIARRIGALLLLQPGLDTNYRAVTTGTYTWPAKSESGQALMF
jgi:hypothetical protein